MVPPAFVCQVLVLEIFGLCDVHVSIGPENSYTRSLPRFLLFIEDNVEGTPNPNTCFLLQLRLKIEDLAVNRGLTMHVLIINLVRLILSINLSKWRLTICIMFSSTMSNRFPVISFVEDFPTKLLSRENGTLSLNADAEPAQHFALQRGLAIAVCGPIDAFEVLKIGPDLCWITAPRQAISG